MTRSLFIIFLFFVVACVRSEVYFSKGSPHVRLSPKAILAGSLDYSRDGRPFSSFTGIPFATFPERFAESQLITNPDWDGVKSFTEPGPVCAQEVYGDLGDGVFGVEDCLNLNVHVPMNNTDAEDRYPVMVWIHGGGFSYGSGSEYGAKYYADEDIILVTINYRLGVFGFLSTADSVVPGNNGLKDQNNALKWVKQNIEKFGGNQNKITIAGESAGSASVSYQLLSPLSNGLFHGAISQSASALGDYPYDPIPKENAIKLAEFVGCHTKCSKEVVNCLRKLSTDQLNLAQFTYKSSFPRNYSSFNFVPTVEPPSPSAFLTVPPVTAFQKGTDIPLMKVPWMIGVTEDEGCSSYAGAVLAEPQFIHELDTMWETIAPDAFFYRKHFLAEELTQVSDKLRKFYFGDQKISLETRTNLTNLYSDQLITHAVWKAGMESASRGNTVYFYEYAYPGPTSLFSTVCTLTEKEAKMVGHADELQHQFDMWGVTLGEKDVVFSKKLIKIWVSFIKYGKPQYSWQSSGSEGAKDAGTWEPISDLRLASSSPKKWFRIEENQAVSVEMKVDFVKRMKFWDNLWVDHFSPAVESLFTRQFSQKGDDGSKTEL